MLIQTPKEFKWLIRSANSTFGKYFEKAGGKIHGDFQQNLECLITGKGSFNVLTPSEKKLAFLQELLSHLIELEQSFAALVDFARLYRSSPKLPKGVSIWRFRKHLLEAHLQELYVFTNRIGNCITFLQRSYSRDKEFEKLVALGSHLKDSVKKKFGELIVIRGRHTHQIRLSHTLEEYRRILFLEGLASTSADSEIASLLLTARREFHREARQKLRDFTMGAKDALLGMTEFLVCYLDTNGLFRIPRRYAT